MREEVELLQLGRQEQQRPAAELQKQQATEVRMQPIMLLSEIRKKSLRKGIIVENYGNKIALRMC